MFKRSLRLNSALISGTICGLLTSPNVFAQGGPKLEEITVTATKRVENLQDVPISVGVVTGDFIHKFDVRDMNEMQNYVPGLQVQSTFGSWAVRVRGLGSGITNLAFDSSVPIYIDGVYCGRGKCLESAFLDVTRLEVARGPQGALFGKSTIAGAISVVTAKPTEEFEGQLKAGAEVENGGYNVSGHLSGPISDSLRGRLAFRYEELDGFVDNVFVPIDEPEEERWGVRGTLAWDATETTSFTLKLETGKSETHGRSNQVVSPGAMATVSTDPMPEFVRNDVRRVSTGVGIEDFYDYEFNLATLTMDTEVAGHTLTGILGYWDYDNKWFLDVDGAPNFILNTNLEDDYKQSSAELRVLSPTGQTVEYIVGAWYQDSDLRTRQFSPFAPAFFRAVLPPFLHPAIGPLARGPERNFQRDTKAYSIYGQATWNVSDRLRAIFDVRYTKEDQDGLGFSFPAVYPDNINPVRYDGPPLFGNTNAEYRFLQKRKDDSTDPSLRIQYDLTDTTMVYGVFASGSKAGGLKANDSTLGNQLLERCADPNYCQTFTGQRSVTPAQVAAGLTLAQENGVFDFEDEESKSFELGTKMSLLDGSATLNIALYRTKFDNLQTSSYDGTRFIIQNAASATVKGFELEGSWQSTENLRINAALAYVDAKYDEFFGAQCIVGEGNRPIDPNCVDGEEDLSGERLERVPEWEANITADWESQLNDSLMLLASLSMYYSSDYFVRQDFAPNGRQDAFTKWDARIGLASSDDRWEVGLVGRNLTNEWTINHAYEIAGDEFASISRGRMVTLEGILRF